MWNDGHAWSSSGESFDSTGGGIGPVLLCTQNGDVLFANAEALEQFEIELGSATGEPWRSLIAVHGGMWHDQRGRLWDARVETDCTNGKAFLVRLRPALESLGGLPTRAVVSGELTHDLFIGLARVADRLAMADEAAEVAQVCEETMRSRFLMRRAMMLVCRRGEWRAMGPSQVTIWPEAQEAVRSAVARGVAVVMESGESLATIALPVRIGMGTDVAIVAEGPADETRVEALHALAAYARTILERNDAEDERRRAVEGLRSANDELLRAYEETVNGWTKALDLRDTITEGHTQRVTHLTVRLARRFGFTERQIESVRRGALLHDIGKMGIPDAILQKDGPLTDDEWAVMRSHTVLAKEWLSPIRFLKDALDIPVFHHEKWDGSGYPHGLRGEEIPLPARIFAVVDVWDALTSDRPYRGAMPLEKARGIIEEGSGSHFDPTVVAAFLAMVDDEEDAQP